MKYLIILLLSISSLMVFAQKDKWQKCKDCSRVSVYYSVVGPADFKVKAEAIENVNIPKAMEVMKDISNYHDWLYSSKLVKELVPTKDGKGIYYLIIGTPWPLKNRDGIIRYEIKEIVKNKEYVVLQNCIPDYIARKDNMVRITRFTAVWKIEYVSDEKTKITYYVEMGGPKNLSPVLLERFLCDGPSATIEGFLNATMEK